MKNTEIKSFLYKGFNCLILEVSWSGHLCGYVEIPEGHILHDVYYSDERFPHLLVHGGITHSGKLHDRGGYFLGFDCAHHGDLLPKYRDRTPGEVYRDEAYVTAQIERLVDQIEKVKKVTFEDYKFVVSE